MTVELLEPIETITSGEQRLTLPGYYNWEEFLTLEAKLGTRRGLRLTYLDGSIELMTVGETHESIKSYLAILLESYFFAKGLKFFPIGSTTQRDESRDVSFEPDESYYLETKKSHPDLALEVIITSGNSRKLEKYYRLQIKEVWFWEKNQIKVYHWRESGYEELISSELLPGLDLGLLTRCVMIEDILEARQELLAKI